MNAQRLGTLIRLELTQRTRSVAWYVLLSVFALLLVIVSVLSFLGWQWVPEPGAAIYSTVVAFTLLLVVLVSPTFSGNAINGDREAATLAPVQVTLATTGEIVIGKFLAAWIAGLAFVAVSVPFLVIATFAGGVDPLTVMISLAVLVVEIGVLAAIGVALSGILSRPLFSVATAYLVVAALVIGTLIAFALAGATIRTETTHQTRTYDWSSVGPNDDPPCAPGQSSTAAYPCNEDIECGEWETYTSETPRFDRVWWMLAPNPFVILGDAAPGRFDANGNPQDVFSQLKTGIAYAQQPPELETQWDECAPLSWTEQDYQTPEEVVAQSVPSWFVGLGLQIVLAGGLLAWAWARTRTPAGRLPRGTRIA